MLELQHEQLDSGDMKEQDQDTSELTQDWFATPDLSLSSGLPDFERLRLASQREYQLIFALVERALKDLEVVRLPRRDRQNLQPWARQSAWDWVFNDDEGEFSFKWCVSMVCSLIGGDEERIVRKARLSARWKWGKKKWSGYELNWNKAQEVEEIICEVCGVKSLAGKKRTGVKFEGRRIAMYVFRYWLKASYPEIAKYFGKHHTTVMHAIKRVSESAGETYMMEEILTKVGDRVVAAKLSPSFPKPMTRASDLEDWDYES